VTVGFSRLTWAIRVASAHARLIMREVGPVWGWFRSATVTE